MLLERLGQLAWIPDYLDDLASDFSVFHRVGDIAALPGPVFFRLAWRLPAYRGVMRERYLTEQHEQETGEAGPAAAPGSAGQRRVVPATKAALSSDEAFPGIFSFGQGGSG